VRKAATKRLPRPSSHLTRQPKRDR
jgi:hypothetical protein